MDLTWLKSVYLGQRSGSAGAVVTTTTCMPRLEIGGSPDEEQGLDRDRPISIEEALASIPNGSGVRRRQRAARKFRPMADHTAFVRRVDTEWKEREETPKIQHTKQGSKPLCDEQNRNKVSEEFPVLSFPCVDVTDIDKHKQLNSDAETSGREKSPCPYESYLQLVQHQIDAQKPKKKKPKQPPPQEDKTPTPKPARRPPRWFWDMSDESASEKAAPQKPATPTPKWKLERVSRVLLDFKYSYAVEQYYRQQMRRTQNPTKRRHHKPDYSDKTEIKFGYVVTTLGANVLNFRARTLPSSNPFELRMRKQLERQKAVTSKKQTGVP